ncbi:hypothetical protein M2139_000749 [Enterococcus sp. PF1-24]|uniref:hypothetical protein n=1 Tax=unclassified Enterococcus TaxID=2608891 RepID=UPI0024745789|nr:MULTISPECIES: hypothetical protein [unclassified Enterococcus]MDH6363632.1 hypothetical protein [Enterococcus sp. PFB1-1]MDH6400867.1 hypothetical protein [Enterococcus sp. PF1-24]
MEENRYEKEIAALRNGESSELVVERADFMLFREVWMTQADKKNFVGEAQFNGRIVYRYQESS